MEGAQGVADDLSRDGQSLLPLVILDQMVELVYVLVSSPRSFFSGDA